MEANDPLGFVAAKLNPRGMIGRIYMYVVNHYALAICYLLNIEDEGLMVSDKIF